MARTRGNAITNGTSGKFGNVVFTADGKMRSRPDTSNRVWSPLQRAHLERVERAKEYARMAISDPELNDFYAQKAARKHGLGAWHMAISHFMHDPVIYSANFMDFHGSPGDLIRVEAIDRFEVAEVMMSFISPEGIILEEVIGTRPGHRSCWVCEINSDIELVPGLQFFFRARNLPGNTGSATLMWPFDLSVPVLFSPAGNQGSRRKREKSQLRTRR